MMGVPLHYYEKVKFVRMCIGSMCLFCISDFPEIYHQLTAVGVCWRELLSLKVYGVVNGGATNNTIYLRRK